MDRNTITTTINIEGNITNLEKAVNEAQKSLSGLSLGKGMKESNAQMFADFKATFERMRELTAGGKLKAIDAKEFEKETDKFNKLWEKLVRVTNSEGLAEKPMQKYATAIEKVKKAQDSLGDKTKDAAKKAEKAIRDQERAVKDLADATDKRKKAEERVAAATAGKEAARQTRNELYDKVFTKKGTTRQAASPDDIDAYNKATDDIKKYNGEIEKANKSLTDLKDKENDAKSALQAANNEVKTTSETLAKLSGSEIEKITADLEKLNINWKELGIDLKSIKSSGDLEAIQQTLREKGLEEAAANVALLTSNMKTATPQVEQFNKEIRRSGDAVKELTEKQKEIENLTNRIKYFFSLSSGAMLFRRVLRQTVQTITELDKVMTETAVVTSYTVGDMWKMLPEYTKRANELGVAIKDVYEADTLYYQQGLKTNEVMAVSNETMKMARIAGLDAAEATDRMTNALRGFNMEITTTNAQNINDVYSNLAAHTASNVQEISVAMTKVASLANSANMSFENTAAFLSQIIETTRESAETAGTALKTVIARFSEVKTLYSKGELMGQDEEGQEVDVNKIGGALRTAGIDLNEYITGAKGLDEIFMELSQKWDSLDMVQQRYIATMAAGSRQQSRFIALMQDYNRMTELTTMANNSAGASSNQFSKTLESLQSLVEKLKNAWNEFLLGFLNTDAVKLAIKVLTGLLDVINKLTNGVGPLSKSFLKAFAAIGAFKLGKAIFTRLTNSVSKIMYQAGAQGAAKYKLGFSDRFKTQKLFSKDFWVKTLPDQKIIKSRIKSVDALNQAYVANGKSLQTNGKINKQLQGYLGQLGIKEKEYYAMKEAGLTTDQIGIITANKDTRAKAKQIIADKSLTAEEKKLALSKLGVTAATAAEDRGIIGNYIAKLANMALTKVSVIVDKTKKGSLLNTAAAWLAEKLAAEQSTAAQLAALGVIGLIIAAVALLITFIYLLIKAIVKASHEKSFEGRLERLNEELEKFTEANEAARSAVDDLSSSADKYKELQNQLSGLVKGSKEWNQALFESNQLVLDLINKYPQLAKYVTTDSSTGGLAINEEGFTSLIKEQQNAVLYTSTLMAGTNKEIAELKATHAADALGAEAQRYAESYLKTGGDLSQLGDQYNEIIQSNSKQYLELNATLQTAVAQQEAYNMALKTTALSMADVDSEINGLVSSVLDFGDFEISENKILGSLNSSEYAEKFVTAMGGESAGYRTNNNKIEYKDGDKWKEYDVKDNKNTVVSVLKKVLKSEKMAEGAKSTDQKISAYLNQSGSVSKEQLTRLLSGPNSWLQEDLEFINNYKGGYTQFLKQFTNNIDKQSQKIKLASEAIGGNWEDIFNSTKEKLKNFTDTDLTEILQPMSLTAMNSFAENIEAVADKYGVTAATAILDNIQSVFVNMPDEIKKQLISTISTIDWESDSWVGTLTNMITHSGLDPDIIQGSLDGVQKLANAVGYNLPQATKNALVELTKFYEELQTGAITTTKIENEEVLKQLKNSKYASKIWNSIWLDTIESLQAAVRDITVSELGNLITGATNEKNNNQQLRNAIITREQEADTIAKWWNEGLDEESGPAKDIYEASVKDTIKYGYLADGTHFPGKADMDTILNGDVFNTEAEDGRGDWLKAESLEEALEMFSRMSTNPEKFLDKDHKIDVNGDYDAARNYITGKWYEQHLDKFVLDNWDVGTDWGLDFQLAYQSYTGKDPVESSEALQELKDFINDPDKLNSASSTQLIWLLQYGEQLGLTGDELTSIKKQIDSMLSSHKDLAYLAQKYNAETATAEENVEVVNKLLEKQATDTLVGNLKLWQEYLKSLDTLEEGSVEWEDTLKSLAANSGLTPEWLRDKDNYNLFTEAVNGSAEALQKLQTTILELNGIKDLSIFEDGIIDEKELENLSKDQIDALVRSGMFDIEYEVKTVATPGKTWVADGSGGVKQIDTTGEASYLVAKLKGKSTSSLVNAAKTAGASSGKSQNNNWLTSLDKYYNLTAAINEQIRKREQMEREYDRMLERRNKTYQEIKQSLLDQQASLRREIDLQRQLRDYREDQIYDAKNEKIQWKEGYSTYAAIGADKYAYWDENEHQVVINWDAIHGITDNDFGSAVESYIKKLEEYEGEWEQYQKALEDAADQLYEINQKGKEQYLELQERVRDALIKQRQLEIDELKNISDEMNKMNSDIISNIQESIQMERQIRDNTKKEEEISDMENRLEYLRRDTSGANQVAILEAQEKLEDARQQYTDTLIDQTIDQMSKDNEKAQEQREKQIDLMQQSLDWDKDHGNFNSQVYELLKDVYGENGKVDENSGLAKLLKNTDNFKYLTEESQMKWLSDMIGEIEEATVGEANFKKSKAISAGEITAEQNSSGIRLSNYDEHTDLWTGEDGKQYSASWNRDTKMFDLKEHVEDKRIKTYGIDDEDKDIDDTENQTKYVTETKYKYQLSTHSSFREGYDSKEAARKAAEAEALQNSYYTSQVERYNEANKKLHEASDKRDMTEWNTWHEKLALAREGLNNAKTALFNQINVVPYTIQKLVQYSTGGLNTSTGPAWLDGTTSKPEYVLNARDTQVYLTLTNLLNKLLSNSTSISDGSTSGGDNYFNIDINVDEIGSDYDVDQLLDRIKTQIVEDASYRNVNAINLSR